MVYLDNSATSYPKPKEVLDAVNESFLKYGANPGRSGHSFSIKSAMKVMEVREKVCDFIGAEGLENVIFTANCTMALNLAILGTCQKGGHIIVTANCHNSVLRPVFEMKAKGYVEVSIAEPSGNDKLTLKDIEKLVRPNTYLICCNHISNVDGMEEDIDEIGKFCYEKCITFLVDGAQSVGNKKIDMVREHIDLLTIAPHKNLYALTGVGVLAFSSKTKINPIWYGGTGTDSQSLLQPLTSPECYESGTLPISSIISLGSGIDFVNKNFEKITEKKTDLTTYLNYELSNIKGVKVYTHYENANGVVGFNIMSMPSNEVSDILDKKFQIMTRSGLHCAPLKHKSLGTLEQGIVRISLSFFNTFNDIQKVVKAVKNITSNISDKDSF